MGQSIEEFLALRGILKYKADSGKLFHISRRKL